MVGRNTSAGFVLLDALVAFAIAAVTLVVIFETLPDATLHQTERLSRHLATEFAFSTLEQYRVTYPNMAPKGEEPSGWSWSIVETDNHETGMSDDPLIKYVTVSVSAWYRDRPELEVTLNATVARRRE